MRLVWIAGRGSELGGLARLMLDRAADPGRGFPALLIAGVQVRFSYKRDDVTMDR